MKQYKTTGLLILGLVLLFGLFVFTLNLMQNASYTQEVDYTTFVQKVTKGEITKVKFTGNVAEGIPKAEEKAAENEQPSMIQRKYKAYIPESVQVDDLLPVMKAQNVKYEFFPVQQEGRWLSFLWVLLFFVIILFFIITMYRNAQGGGSQAMSFGKSRAKLSLDNKVKVTFKDVAGIDESKAELEEVVDFLKNAERYQKLGAKIPRGVLLVGSPGTGKTLLAKAVAGEAGVPFFSISGSDFVEMFVGVGASRVRDLFEQAKKHAPCIIFVDEIDAVGRQRGAGMGGGHDEREQTLNQLLVEMDGFDQTSGIIVLAATNRPDILDQALLRPGRFDRQVVIDRPDVKGREEILNVHAKGKPLADDVNLRRLAKRTPGFTGADLSNLLNEGALTAARQDKEIIEMEDIESSIDKVIAGVEKKNKLISEREKEITAYHEVGHALVAIMTPGCDPIRKVTIIPRGMALGLTWTMPDDENVHVSRTQILGRIAMTLGGRAAEEIIYGEQYTGASNDLEKVAEWARRLVTTFGMSAHLGPIAFGKENQHVFMGRDFGSDRNYGEEVASVIDREIKELVNTQFAYAKRIVTDNRDLMDAIVRELLEKETLEDHHVYDIIARIMEKRGFAEHCMVNAKSLYEAKEDEEQERKISSNGKGKKADSNDSASETDGDDSDSEKSPVAVKAGASSEEKLDENSETP